MKKEAKEVEEGKEVKEQPTAFARTKFPIGCHKFTATGPKTREPFGYAEDKQDVRQEPADFQPAPLFRRRLLTVRP